MVKIMENPYFLMDDLGVPLFLETPIYSNLDDEWVPGSQLTPRSETKTKTNRDYMTLAEMSIPSSSHSYSYKHITFTIHPPTQVPPSFLAHLYHPKTHQQSLSDIQTQAKRPRKLYYPSVLVDPDGIQWSNFSWFFRFRFFQVHGTGPGMRWVFFQGNPSYPPQE